MGEQVSRILRALLRLNFLTFLRFLFTANKQSLDGVVDVTNRAMLARNRLPFDRGALLPLPIPARFEQREEYKRAKRWKSHFLKAVGPFYDRWVTREVDYKLILELTTIPYVPYWSFGEEIAVLQESTRSPHLVSYHIETLAALLAHRLHRTDLLASSREEYVDAARRLAQRRNVEAVDVFVSYPTKHFELARQLVRQLTREELKVFWFGDGDERGGDWVQRSQNVLNAAKNLIVLKSEKLGPLQRQEVYTFMKQSLADERPRRVLPLLVGPPGTREPDPALANFRQLDIRGQSISDALPDLLSLLER